jgi:hypothetical protein
MIMHGGLEEWTNEMIKDVFFTDQKVWIKLNSLVLAMQRYVMRNPDYQESVESDSFDRGLLSKEAEDFCMVNYHICRIEFKSFYLIKTMEGDTRYFNEDLMKFDDFSVYLPLF